MATIPRPVLAATVAGLLVLLAALATTVVGVGGPGKLMDMDSSRQMGVEIGNFKVLGGIACGGAWIIGGTLLYRRFARRSG